jgi:hypothetical protein
MGQGRFKLCRECLEYLSMSPEHREDLSTYLVVTSSSGVQLVDAAECLPRLVCSGRIKAEKAHEPRSLEHVTDVELEEATSAFIKQLKLPSSRKEGAWDLGVVIRNEWLKALKNSSDK